MAEQKILVWADGTANSEAYYSEHRDAWVFVDHLNHDLHEVEEWVEVTLDYDYAPADPIDQYRNVELDWADCGLNQATIACDLEGRGKWVVDAEDFAAVAETYGDGLAVTRIGTRDGAVLTGKAIVDWFAAIEEAQE